MNWQVQNLCADRYATTWHESDAWDSGCQELNYANAKAFCESQGGRLPTLEEVEDGCVAHDGCGFNFVQIWTSTVPTTTLQPTAEPTTTPTLEPTLAPTMAYDCTVEVFKSFPDNSESELVYEENTWIDLSLEGISSLIVTGTCSVTVRDEDENVLATYTEGTYICCGAAADQTRFPNAQGLTWNDKIRSVYLYSTLGVESTEDWNFVNEDST